MTRIWCARESFRNRTRSLLLSASALAFLSAEAAFAQSGSTSTESITQTPPAASAQPVAGNVMTAQNAPSAPEEVVVTGSLLGSAEFATPTPVTGLGPKEIQADAPGSVFDVIKNIPALAGTTGPTSNSSGAQSASKSNLNLYDLGSTRTLVLIDGQRHVPDGQTNVFDTNLIPISLVQRIDVVTGGASATYGSDAVAGVVNFILEKNFEGFKGDIHYGISQFGDNGEFEPSFAYGTSLFGGHGHFEVGADITIGQGTGNFFTRSWGRLEPGVFTTPSNRPAGMPSQIAGNNISTSAYNASGLIVSGPLKGIAFGDNGTTSQFQYGTIVGSTEMQGGNDYGSVLDPDEALVAAYDRGAALARFEYDFDGNFLRDVYLSVNYGHLNTFGDSFGAQVPNFNQYPVLITNPFLPANIVAAMQADHITSFNYSATRDYDLGSISSRNRTDTVQGNFGIHGGINNSWFGEWDWKANLGIGEAAFVPDIHNTPVAADFFESAYVVPGPNGVPVCGPVATNPYFNAQNPLQKALLLATLQPGCIPYNIFGTNKVENQAAINWFNSASEEDNEFRQYTFTLDFTGTVFQLPAGEVPLAFGYDFRRDAIHTVNCAECMLDALMNQNYSTFAGRINVNEGYAETEIPLLRDFGMGDISLARALAINAAVRNTDYSTSGDVTTWKYGFTWDVNDSFRLRGTRSSDIRAPNLNELYNPGSQGNANVVNQVTGTSGYIKTNTVGNPNLRPEEGNTWTGGVVFEPAFDLLSSFRASVDYYQINVTKIIATLPVQTVLNDYFLNGPNSIYAQFVTPSSATSVGVSNVNSPELNLNSERTSGINFELDYDFPFIPDFLGSFKMRTLGTYMMRFDTATLNGTIGSVGTSSTPRFKGETQFSYVFDQVEANFLVTFQSATKYNDLLVGLDGLTPGTAQYNTVAALPNSINKNIWPNAVYLNINLAYDLYAREDNRKVQLYLDINNVLNAQPPVIADQISGSPWDLVGRDFKMGIRFAY